MEKLDFSQTKPPSPRLSEPQSNTKPTNNNENSDNDELTYKCWRCRDKRFFYLPIPDVDGHPNTHHPLYGKAVPCLWCARVKGGFYADTEKGQELRALEVSLGCEVP